MANVKQMVSDVLGTINGALAILDKVPQVEETSGNLEFGMSVSPFTLILEVLKNTKGYNYVLDWIGDFLVLALPGLEVALKTLLMTNLKGLITCSLNPIIPNDLLLNGIVFDLKEIDIFNMLSYCPLDEKAGNCYYFGVNSVEVPDDLRRSQDFNAFLWYMVNRSNCREIWNRCTKGLTTILHERIIGETTNKEFTDDLGDYTENMLNSTLNSQNLPLKDLSCVDIDLSTVDENGNNEYLKDKNSIEWINAKWNDVFFLTTEDGLKILNDGDIDIINNTDFKNVKKLFYKNNTEEGFIYLTNGDIQEPIVYIAEEYDDEWYYDTYTFTEDLFDISDNLYEFKVKECYHISQKGIKEKDKNTKRNCIYKIAKKYLKVQQDTIEKKDDIRYGIFDKNQWGSEYNLEELDTYRVKEINEGEYYYCNYLGYVYDKDKKIAVKFPKKYATYEIKKNLLTGVNKNVKIGISLKEKKLKKNAGIITLEYNEDSASVTNAIGGQVSGLSIPYRNCLHVFLGNVQPQNYGDIIKIRKEIRKCEEDKKQAQYQNDICYKTIEKKKKKYDDVLAKHKTEITKDNADDNVEEPTEVKNAREDYERTQTLLLKSIQSNNNTIAEKDNSILAYESAIYASAKNYRSIEQNYYYKRTLIEFNFDYIWSLKLFDPKVVAAQLIDAVVGLTKINLGLSYERIFTIEELENIVRGVIEKDDSEINDCFFTFSNDQYNSLVVQSEKRHQGLYSTNPNQEGIKIDYNAIQDSLNSISAASTKEEQITAIKGALNTIEGIISNVESEEKDVFNKHFGGIDFIENLLTNLAMVIAQTFLSPKVHLLILVNMRIMGNQTDVTFEMLIGKLKNLIIEMIRLVRDKILDFFTEKLMEILKEISINVGVKLSIEQALYYYNLIKKLIDCFKINGKTLGFTVDEVNYADIYAQEPTPPTEC